jgi:GxxExxY protein
MIGSFWFVSVRVHSWTILFERTGSTVEREGLLLKDEVYAIVGAAMEVHTEMGAGFLEHVYQESMELELGLRRIPFESQKVLQIRYKGTVLKKDYCADFVCFGQIIVEIKAMRELTGREEAQLLNYLKATGLRVGVLINFGDPGRLDWKRLVR